MSSVGDESEEGGESASRFYAALALDRLGRAGEAARILDGVAVGPADGRKSAYDYYLAGLVENYRQQDGRAEADFHRALALDPELWQARLELQREGTAE